MPNPAVDTGGRRRGSLAPRSPVTLHVGPRKSIDHAKRIHIPPLHVSPPGGFKPALTFAAGKMTADSGPGVKATKSGDLWSVDVNDYEHYQILGPRPCRQGLAAGRPTQPIADSQA